MREQPCLDGLTWRASVEHLARLAPGPADTARVLKMAYLLEQLSPPPYDAWIRCDLDEQRFDSMIANGALDSAACAVVGPMLRHQILDADVGEKQARVWIDGVEATGTGNDATRSRALVKAWLGCVLVLMDLAPSIGL